MPARGVFISSAWKQRVVRIHLLDNTLGPIFHHILRHHHVARHSNRIVGLRRDDQAKRLQVCGHCHFASVFSATRQDLAEIHGKPATPV